MLIACSRCGKIHERDKCTLVGGQSYGGIRFRGHSESGGRVQATQQQLFRNTSAWQRKRHEILKRDNFCCRVCLDNKILTRDGLQVHHIVPIREADHLKLEDRNLITLCYSCHEMVEHDKSKRAWLMYLADSPPAL